MEHDIFGIRAAALPHRTRVLAFTGTEAISKTYAFEIYLLVPQIESHAFDMEAAIASRATLDIRRDDGVPRAEFHGIFSSLELIHELPGDALYRAVLVPKLWQAKLSEHSRVFTHETIPQILEAVLKRSGLATDDFELRLAKTYRPHDHVCQYGESNFDFVSRWMEREGMYYFFEQGDEKEKLVITDDRSFHAPNGQQSVRYFPRAGHDTSGVEAFETFTCRHTALPANVHLKDYDYLAPRSDLSGGAHVSRLGHGTISRHGENFSTTGDGKRLAAVQAQELSSRQVIYQATGRVFELRPGTTFELEEHPRASFNREFLTVELEHQGNNASSSEEARSLVGLEDEAAYKVHVSAIASDVQFRAERTTPTPRIYGYEGATVDGPADTDYAQIDAHGRYAVKAHFDESDLRGGRASMWVRMAQPHGGNPEGFHFPLRRGTEVLLAFLGGDPDRPVIASVVPNADNPSPVTAANHTLNVIQTGGENRFEIQDTEGAQYVKFTTPHKNTMLHLGAPHNPTHNIHASTDGNCKIDLGTNWDIEVGTVKHEHVVANVTEDYDADHTYVVDGTQSSQIGGNKKQLVIGNQVYKCVGSTDDNQIGSTTEGFIGPKVSNHFGETTTLTVGTSTSTSIGASTCTFVGGQTNVTIADIVALNMADSLTTTMGDSTLLTMGDSTSTTIGSVTSTTVGSVQSTTVGALASLVVGASSYTLVGGFSDIVLASTSHMHIGTKMDITAASAIEATFGTHLSLHEAVELEIKGGHIVQKAAEVKDTSGPTVVMTSVHITQQAVFLVL